MTNNLLLAAALAVAFAGCNSIQSTASAGSAAAGPKISVDSTGVAKCPERGLKMRVNPDPVHYSVPQDEFTIVWRLPNGYKFATHQIPDPTPISGPAGEIHDCHAGGPTMECKNRGQHTGQWKYVVDLVSSDDNCPVPDLDPIISND